MLGSAKICERKRGETVQAACYNFQAVWPLRGQELRNASRIPKYFRQNRLLPRANWLAHGRLMIWEVARFGVSGHVHHISPDGQHTTNRRNKGGRVGARDQPRRNPYSQVARAFLHRNWFSRHPLGTVPIFHHCSSETATISVYVDTPD